MGKGCFLRARGGCGGVWAQCVSEWTGHERTARRRLREGRVGREHDGQDRRDYVSQRAAGGASLPAAPAARVWE